jgi:hypothetical protein
MPQKRKRANRSRQTSREAKNNGDNAKRADLVALFRLLLREPPADHDFKTCPLCKRYGITSI